LRGQVIAKRYARALFAIGQEQGDEAVSQFGRELTALAEILEGAPALLRVFKNPVIRTEAKKGVLQSIMDKMELSKTVHNYCLFLADKGRLEYFLDIQRYYSMLLDMKEGIMRGKLVTAIELTKAKKDGIKTQLEEQFAHKLVLDYESDKDILGGLVLKVGDKVYDASLKAQLEQMKETIKRGE
jgi:F-type H+-transporting ATPase subunit delta